MPAFFSPKAEPDIFEAAYSEMANLCHCAVPALGERVYSITFSSKGETWTATVGEELRGTRLVTRGRGRTKREFQVPLANAATVIAIFPGVPYHVWHDGASRVWANPFLAGDILSVTRFS